jgi:hypothetical protein
MEKTIYQGVAKPGGNLQSFLQKQFGALAQIEGNDLVLSDSAVEEMLSKDAIRLHSQTKLT